MHKLTETSKKCSFCTRRAQTHVHCGTAAMPGAQNSSHALSLGRKAAGVQSRMSSAAMRPSRYAGFTMGTGQPDSPLREDARTARPRPAQSRSERISPALCASGRPARSSRRTFCPPCSSSVSSESSFFSPARSSAWHRARRALFSLGRALGLPVFAASRRHDEDASPAARGAADEFSLKREQYIS